jgi:hypothetical protein
MDSLTPEDEDLIRNGDQSDWKGLVDRLRISTKFQKRLLNNYGRTDDLDVLEMRNISIYEHYLSLLDVERAIPLRTEIENCKRRMNRRELRPHLFDSRQLQHYGLVVGRIQSGKTGHLLGLSLLCLDDQKQLRNPQIRRKNKSAEIVIILTGLIDDLRKQTLDRFDNDTRNFASIDNYIIGPSRGKDLTQDKKFQSKIADYLDPGNKNTGEKMLLIIKKNHSVVEKLIEIIDGIETPARRRLGDVIIIDDECDYASMDSNNADQTNAKETRTNLVIRKLIDSFRRSDRFRALCWYIGYTATPFSNLLVNPYGEGTDEMPTLFPRGFIYPISKNDFHIDNEYYFQEHEGKKHIFYIDQNIAEEE